MAKRIIVIGTSAAGKTSLSHALAEALDAPRIELDELFWSAGWVPKPVEDFRQLVHEASVGDRWVVDGNYSVIRDVLWPRAEVVVWLNYSLPLVFWRGLKRCVFRSFTGHTLWHGNRESIGRTFFSKESILWWILSTHRRRTRNFRELRASGAYPHLAWVEFRRPGEAERWLRALRPR